MQFCLHRLSGLRGGPFSKKERCGMNTLPIITGLLGMGIVFLLIPLILKLCLHTQWFERTPDLHHTHKNAIPRLGGIALAAAFVGIEVLLAVFFPEQGDARQLKIVVGSSLAMFGIGLWDDIGSLGAKRKFLGQVLIAAAVYSLGIGIQSFKIPFTEHIINLGAWGGLITVVWLVSMTNLINLIDGVDGLAGGICLMLMALLAWVGHQSLHLGLVASGMAGALLGFLWFNFPPARIYMGDSGAYFLGFQIGLFTIVNSQKGTILPALVARVAGLSSGPQAHSSSADRHGIVAAQSGAVAVCGHADFSGDGFHGLCVERQSGSRAAGRRGAGAGALRRPVAVQPGVVCGGPGVGRFTQHAAGHSVCLVPDALADHGRQPAEIGRGPVVGPGLPGATARFHLGQT